MSGFYLDITAGRLSSRKVEIVLKCLIMYDEGLLSPADGPFKGDSESASESWLLRTLLSVCRSDSGVVRGPRQRRLCVHWRRRGLLCHQRPGRHDGRRGRRRRGRGGRQRWIPVVILFYFLKKEEKKAKKKKKVKRANCFIWSNCTFLGDFPGRFLIVLTAYGLLSVYRLFYSKEKKKKNRKTETPGRCFMIPLPLRV